MALSSYEGTGEHSLRIHSAGSTARDLVVKKEAIVGYLGISDTRKWALGRGQSKGVGQNNDFTFLWKCQAIQFNQRTEEEAQISESKGKLIIC